ncbi:Hypothetical predicted protein [Lecanosticta acicola]|uniref:Uncharacterized protein n=1 Tax=Lecanosticta acicola TaxID=111012 RepID=A0AAI8Z860_9PEZI|nr:Hypothetical predicted protein [Lecanosticta acicola]
MIRQERSGETDLSTRPENQGDEELSRVAATMEVDTDEYNRENEANDGPPPTPAAHSARRRSSRKTLPLSGRTGYRDHDQMELVSLFESENCHGGDDHDMEEGPDDEREDTDSEAQACRTAQQAKPRGRRRTWRSGQSDRPVRARAFSCFDMCGKDQTHRTAIGNRLYKIWGDDVTTWPTYSLHPTPMALEKEQRMVFPSDKRLDPPDWGLNFLRAFLQLVETAQGRGQEQLLAAELERAVNRRMRQGLATDKNFITMIDLWDVLHLSLIVRLELPRSTVRRRSSTLGARDGSQAPFRSSQLGARRQKHSEVSTGASLGVQQFNIRQNSEAYVASREQASTLSEDHSQPSPIAACLDTNGERSETSAELVMQEAESSNRHDSHRASPSHMSDDGAPPSLKADFHAWIIKQVEEKGRLEEEIARCQHEFAEEERQIDERQNTSAEYRSLADEYQRKADAYMRKAGAHQRRAEQQDNEAQSLKRGLGERTDQITGKRAKLETVKARLLASIGV